MLSIPPQDEAFESLIGAEIPSEILPGTSYRIVWQLGQGGMSVVFYAIRVTADGETPVVVKMTRPNFVRTAGPTAALIVKKEAIALGRLNERVPPTPFVLRFIDTGEFPVESGGERVTVPWVVVEYVHGGAEGTTLSERVDRSLATTGAGFDAGRAAHAVECLTTGLYAVHEVGVIHRDLKPDNVLCCGFGEAELFKIADFGVARPAGVATFTGAVVGTPGFVAPELTTGDSRAIGPWTDIFSLGAMIFFMLTGEEYFDAKSPADALVMAVSKDRKKLIEAPGLCPELRAREQACRAIDFALSCATAGKIDARPHRADALAAMLLPWLRIDSIRPAALAKRLDQLRDDEEPTRLQRWTWTSVRSPSTGMTIRGAAWDGDGRAMVATNLGLRFWNGSGWAEVDAKGLPAASAVRFVQRAAAGRWLVGCEDRTVATISPAGVTDARKLPECPLERIDRVAGDLDDLAVFAGIVPSATGGAPVLCTLTSRRWLKPMALPDVAAVSSIARVEDARWLVTGRSTDGKGFAAIYAPMELELERLKVSDVRAYLSCVGQVELGVALATGAEGAVIFRQGSVSTIETIDGGHDLSAAGIDAVGRAWAASAGRIWLRRARAAGSRKPARWDLVFHDPTRPMPIVSLFADLGVVVALTADGGIIEGRVFRPDKLADEDSSIS